MTLGRVVTCPEGWMALKRKPRNRALFALCCIGAPGKIKAGLGRQKVQCNLQGLMHGPAFAGLSAWFFNGFQLFCVK